MLQTLFGAFFGALFGAFFAFQVQAWLTWRKEKRDQFQSGLMALYALQTQLMLLDTMDNLDEEIERGENFWASVLAHVPISVPVIFKPETLPYLVPVTAGTLMRDAVIAQQRFHTILNLVRSLLDTYTSAEERSHTVTTHMVRNISKELSKEVKTTKTLTRAVGTEMAFHICAKFPWEDSVWRAPFVDDAPDRLGISPRPGPARRWFMRTRAFLKG